MGKDSLFTLNYFVYEHSPIDYVLFDFTDSVKMFLKHKEVKMIEKIASGTIVTSLWNAMVNNKINPVVAVELSEIYAWTVDFLVYNPVIVLKLFIMKCT
ncbi:MAG: hypothetical protein HC906_06845 [Bacteroidales bacterium]|nr:hypothetical protein [Bacteroidales bacterium]